jgi:hypothetical protein
MDVVTLCFEYPGGFVETTKSSSTTTTSSSRNIKPVFHSTSTSTSSNNTSTNGQGRGDDDGITTYQQYADSQFEYLIPADDANSQDDSEFDEVHAKCIAISEATGCLVSAVRPESGKGDGKNGGGAETDANGSGKAVRCGWQFQLSGGDVMDARRRIMDQFRPDVSAAFCFYDAFHVSDVVFGLC